MNSQDVQQYVRIALYQLWAVLGTYGITLGGGTKELVGAFVGTLATLAWTIYGSRISARLEDIKNRAGVQSIEIKLDPDKIDPNAVNAATPAGVVAKAA